MRARRLTKARRKQIARDAALARENVTGRGNKKGALNTRSIRMAKLYRAGKTLEEIGQLEGITRERVRQILAKMDGHSSEFGGVSVRTLLASKEKTIARKENKNKKTMDVYGCSIDEFIKIQGDNVPVTLVASPACYYRRQKNAADFRGIPWKFTFTEWWGVWQKSGKWQLRGRGKDKYCMSRIGDAGEYSSKNVVIKTNLENIQEGFLTSPSKERQDLARKYGKKVGVFTKIDIQILTLREQGKSRGEIADELGMRPETVSMYLTALKQKTKPVN
jgi:DNA-binding CsgD family transcriptional regulator